MRKTLLAKVNGQGKANGTIPRKVLERNVMDIITDRKWSFDDCADFVETADKQTLMDFLREYDLAEDYEAVVDKYMERFLA